MDKTGFENLPPDLQEKVRKSREAYELAAQVSSLLEARFPIRNIQVAATENKLVVCGVLHSETEVKKVDSFLKQNYPNRECDIQLSIE